MVGGLVGGIILFIIAAILLVLSGIYTDFVLNLSYAGIWAVVISALLILLGLTAILYGTSIWYLLLYKAWDAIQDDNASTTPQKAVGFIFIPFYNFYWIFKAWWGFAGDYNRYTSSHGLKAPKIKEGLFLAFCILFICITIPILNYVAGLPFLVIFTITSNEAIDGINAVLAKPASAG